MKILIVKTTSMGDVVHAIPVLSDIKANYPDSRIDWLVEEPFADIVKASPLVSNVHVCNVRKWRRSPFSAGVRRQVAKLKASLKEARYDIVVDLQGLIKSMLLGKMAGSELCGYDKNSIKEKAASFFYDRKFPVSRSKSAVERCRVLCALALGYPVPEARPVFDFGGRETSGVSKTAVFFANASRETKLWPESKWTELGKQLASRGYRIRLAWNTEEEGKRAKRIAEGIGDDATLLERQSIARLMKVVSSSALVIGLDTGMTHLSSAMGTPTVAIFRDYPVELVPLEGPGKKKALGGVNCCPEVGEVVRAIDEISQ